MKKLIVFLLTFFISTAYGACTVHFFNDSDDFVWVLPQDMGNETSWKALDQENLSHNTYRMNPQNSEADTNKKISIPADKKVYVYTEARSMGGQATPGLIGGTYLVVKVSKVYEINFGKKCPKTLNISDLDKNNTKGITVKKAN